MNNQITIKDGIQWRNSLELSNKTGVKHSHILRTIDSLIKKNICNLVIKKSSYVDNSGKKNRMFLLSSYTFNYILSLKKTCLHNARIEPELGKILEAMFPNEIIEKQYKIGKYRLDFYLPWCDIIVEYDEGHHKYTKESDEERMCYILEEIKKQVVNGGYKHHEEPNEHLEKINKEDITRVIRIQEGNEIDGLRRLLCEITEHTMLSATDFMQ